MKNDDLRERARTAFAAGDLKSAVNLQLQLVNDKDNCQPSDFSRLGMFFYSLGDYQAALRAYQEAFSYEPSSVLTMQNIAVCYRFLKDYSSAISWAKKAIEVDQSMTNAWDCLVASHYFSGDKKSAVKYGQQCLEYKIELAKADGHKEKPDVEIPVFRPDHRDRNVIAFSLWGDKPQYISGAVKNAELCPHIYPEWRCRFYCDESVPQDTRKTLQSLGAEVILMPERRFMWEGLFWRFYVANDPGVDRYLIRDADSVINLRERYAVMEWVGSDKPFHLMRDHCCHTVLILAGMWGGVTGALPDIKELAVPYFNKGATNICDQFFLRQELWPRIEGRVMMHDDHYKLPGTKPYPKWAHIAYADHGAHIGENYFIAKQNNPTSLGSLIELREYE